MANEDAAGSGARERAWTSDDTVALLKRVADFRARTGSTPTSSSMPAFFAFVKHSLPLHITQGKLYNKLRHIRHKHHQASRGPHHDPLIHELCDRLWGRPDHKKVSGTTMMEEDTEMRAHDDRGDEEGLQHLAMDVDPYLCVMDAVAEYCRMNGGLSTSTLEESLKLVDASRVAALERKWRRHWQADMMLNAKRLGLSRKLFHMLRTS